jgi:hypothetical protein
VGGNVHFSYGTILTSPDGVTWTPQNSGANAVLDGVTYGSGKFVAVGKDGMILTSLTGATWTTQSSGTTNHLSGVTYGNGTFVAVVSGFGLNDQTMILTSPDGVTWTKLWTESLNSFFGITYGNRHFVAVGSAILTSPDGTIWTENEAGTTNELGGVTYGNGTFVTVGVNGTIMQSDQFLDIKSAISSTLSGYYKTSSIINITLKFTEPVSSTGLTIKLNTGESIATGPFSNKSSFSSTYTVRSGENVAALNISNITGTIEDATGVKARPTVPPRSNIADSKTIVIDTTKPVVMISAPSASTTQRGPVTYKITYADSNFYASALWSGNISLNKTGTANGVISSVTGTGKQRTVTISSITGSGTLGISIAAGTAIDNAGNRASATGPSPIFTVDN